VTHDHRTTPGGPSTDPIIQRLHYARHDAGLSLNRLAEQAGIAKGFLSEVEAGKHSLSLPTLRRWAGALGLEVTLTQRAVAAEREATP
jgi:transcriptional regulator with XRE-family HTH domain